MKVVPLNAIVYYLGLLLIGFRSWNAVRGENTDQTDESSTQTTTVSATFSSASALGSDSESEPTQLSTMSSAASEKPSDVASVVTLPSLSGSLSRQSAVVDGGDSEDEEMKLSPNKQPKALVLVAEIIGDKSGNGSHYDNSFVLKSLFNLSASKYDVQPIGEPFNFSYIFNLEFAQQAIGFSHSDKMTNFSNIRIRAVNAAVAQTPTSTPSPKTVNHSSLFYTNNFTCTSQGFEVALNVIPENMNVEGNYLVQDKSDSNNTSKGSFIFKQTGARLIYKFADMSQANDKDVMKIHKHADLIYTNGQVKFTQLCDNQCDLLTSSAQMFNNTKSHILEKFPNTSLISTRIDQFTSTFPFLSICSSPSSSQSGDKHSYRYVIEGAAITKKCKSGNLVLGPMILQGLDNLTDGNVVAQKSSSLPNINSFRLSAQANHVRGQCDWRYQNHLHYSSVAVDRNYSFTFVIEQVRFLADADFSESWNVSDLRAMLGKVSIHRYDKNCAKILDFAESILQDFVREAVSNSLQRLFRERFSNLSAQQQPISPPTTRLAPITLQSGKPKSTAADGGTVVAVPHLLTDQTEATTTPSRSRPPFPKRKVFTACKDTRRWWQKLFYRNKCLNTNGNENE